MVLSLGMQHNLTWDAQVDILKLLAAVTGCQKMPCSKTAYHNYIDKMNHAICFHTFCRACDVYIGPRNQSSSDIPHEAYLCDSCDKVVDHMNPANFFISVSIEEQLKTIMADEQFARDLVTHRFERRQDDELLSDIYDGAQYRQHCGENGILSSKFNFSWTIFTDGISTGRSTGKTMWPIYLTLNESPKKVRHKYMILAGLFVGDKEPNPWVFFQPFIKEANKLVTEGFTWAYEGATVVSRVIPLLIITDSAARFQILNFQSYLAYYGCTFCYQVQEPTAPRKRRFDAVHPPAPLRTAESTKLDCVQAHYRARAPIPADRVYRGVKGPSAVMGLNYFELIRGFAVNSMHAIFLGMIKMHMELLFEPFRNKFWINKTTGVQERQRLIDERVLKINPPSGITRNTRPISSYKLWKASEWRSWLLFYCIPCLEGFLKHKHLVHLAQLSKATCLLLQMSVSRADIAESRHLFTNYAQSFQTYFDVEHKHTIYNVHLLKHVPTCVEDFGPLWTLDSFPYEGQNRHVLQLLTGYNHAAYQVSRRFFIFVSLPRLCRDFVTTEIATKFAETILSRNFQRYTKCGQCVLTGKLESRLSPELSVIVQNYAAIPAHVSVEMQCYNRVLFNGMRLTTASLVGNKQNNDSFVFLKGRDRHALRITHIVNITCSAENLRTSIYLIGEVIKIHKDCVWYRVLRWRYHMCDV